MDDHTPAWLRSPRRFVIALIIATLLGRIVMAMAVGLGVDESYQAAVSRPLSLSYFDHPPLSFWIPGIVGALTGSMNRVVLRLPFILLFAGTTWMMYRLSAQFFGERAGAIAALILNIAPVLSVSAGGWVLPDGPLMFWMLATTLCLERVLVPRAESSESPRAPVLWWIAAGVCAGLALLSKYHGVFLLAGTGLYLITSRDGRRWLLHPGPYIAGVIAVVMFTPVLYWNAQHDWISFRFQGGRGAPEHGLHLLPFLQNVTGQLGYLLPWIGIPLAWVLVRDIASGLRGPSAHSARLRDARWLLVCLAIGPIAAFTLVALGGHRGLPHWQAPGWLMVIPLLAERVDARLESGSARTRSWTSGWLVASSIAFVALMAIAVSQTNLGWMENVVQLPRFVRKDATIELLDWTELRSAIVPLLRAPQPGSAAPFVAATSWMDAGKVGYALQGRADVACLCTEPHQFAFTHDAGSLLSRDAVIVGRAGMKPSASELLSQNFRSIRPIDTVVVHRGKRAAITLVLYRGEALVSEVSARAP